MQRHLSSPAKALFGEAEVSPQQIDAALDELVQARASTVLRIHHPLVQRVHAATGINLIQVSRRSRNLLIQIEQACETGPAWQYREHTPRRCTFACRGQLPDTIENALQGELLEKLVVPAAAMEGVVITKVGNTSDGWLTVDVAPTWHLF